MERMDKLQQVMELYFCLLDLNLYLDTHPNDTKTLKKFEAINEDYMKVRQEYVTEYGPLLFTDVTDNGKRWQWINDPWPWQLENY